MIGPIEAAGIGALAGTVVTPLTAVIITRRDRVRRGLDLPELARSYAALKADVTEYIPLFALSFIVGPIVGALLGLAAYAAQNFISH